jgi:hypothetical protein
MSGAAKPADHGGRTGALPGPPRSGERAVRRGGVRAVAVRYPVASFVVLAFVVSWAAWGPLLADRQGWVQWSASTYLHLLGGLGPLVAAVPLPGWVAVGTDWGVVEPGDGLARSRPLAGPGHSRAAGNVPDGRGRGAAGRGSVAGAGSVRGQHRVPGPADRDLLARQPRVLRVRRGGRLARLPPTDPGTAMAGAGSGRRPQCDLGAVVPAVVRDHRRLPAAAGRWFVGFYFSLLVAALVFAWLWHRSGYSLLVVAVFHAVFDIATTTPTDTTLIPILMGTAVSLAGLAAIPALRTMEPSPPPGAGAAPGRPPAAKEVQG